uniref:60S ribosomal protein L36 n=1 Tax=Leersia perrieri TaxID=77586 RepID=A0A0D9W0T2_9ORYZ
MLAHCFLYPLGPSHYSGPYILALATKSLRRLNPSAAAALPLPRRKVTGIVKMAPPPAKTALFVWQVARFAPYEKHISELLKVGKDKTKKKARAKRAKTKREETTNVLRKMRANAR